jgi:DNA-binding winged helix-turn-helix (wHTH) protein/Tol biopolymer transport system component
MNTDPNIVYEFGPFRLDPDKQILLRDGQPIPVPPKSFETLLVLVRRGREVVTKEELLNTVWPDSFVEEANLSQHIFKLRKALGDTQEGDRYIVTLPGRGYRFAVPVRTITEGRAEGGEVLIAQIRSRTQIMVEEHAPEPVDVQPVLQMPGRARQKWLLPSGIIAAIAIVIVAGLFLYRLTSAPPAVGTQWEQLTFFTDSAVYPALSSDGRMLAFIRGSDSFLGPGQIYVELLPGGEPVQLTHDSRTKLAPSFSPDNSFIVYSVVEPWDTWRVPVLGGEPHLLLPNSSSVSWIEGGKQLLYSEIIEGLHLKVVTSDEARGNSRDVYVPQGNRSMAHHSYLSPDGRWVLIVEMNGQGEILPCRIVPFQGPMQITAVGPPKGPCRAGAWSPDGKWIYLTAKTDDFHIWRQRFPDGKPEQLTFGPTSQEGIALASDGKSLITSVGSQDHTLWLHDKDGDHQISSEGDASLPTFSPDGQSLYFLMANGRTHGKELWVKDLNGGNVDRVLPGYPIQTNSTDSTRRTYSVSADSKQVAFCMIDQSGRPNLWIAPTDHRWSPRRIPPAAQEDSPRFLPDGELVFRAMEGGSNYLYRMKADGTDRRKIIPDRILEIEDVSPDGRWVVVGVPNANEQYPVVAKAFALDGSASMPLCVIHCELTWDSSGKFVYIVAQDIAEHSYAFPVLEDTGLPKISPAPIARIEDLQNAKTGVELPWVVGAAYNSSKYAYLRENTRRNLYRIQLP